MSTRLGAALVCLLVAAPSRAAQAELRRPGPALGWALAGELSQLARHLTGTPPGVGAELPGVAPPPWLLALTRGWQDLCTATDQVSAGLEDVLSSPHRTFVETLREMPVGVEVASLLQLSLSLPDRSELASGSPPRRVIPSMPWSRTAPSIIATTSPSGLGVPPSKGSISGLQQPGQRNGQP